MNLPKAKPRLIVLVSGRGRNLQALHRACADGRIPADLVAVISNRRDAPALDYAARSGMNAIALPHDDFSGRSAYDVALAATLREQQPDIIAMAGFMRIVGDAFIAEFRGRMLNIHPSLLPKYPGLHTHRRALQAADAEHGATVHFVTEQLDGGPQIIQGAVNLEADDDDARLAERVMEQIELKIYPQAVAWMARGELRLNGDWVCWRGAPLYAPLNIHDLEDAFR